MEASYTWLTISNFWILSDRIISIRTGFDKLFVVMFSDFWKNTPLIALILLGGLSSINPNLYEAAAVDGAGAFRRFFHITFPNIAPLMAIALLIRGVSEFNIFALPQVLIGDNPPSMMNTVRGSTTSSCASATPTIAK